MSVSCILHGAVWPDAGTVERLRAAIRTASPDAEILDARENGQQPAGAAAAINAAVARAHGRVLVVLEPWAAPDADALSTYVRLARDGVVIERRDEATAESTPSPLDAPDLLAALADIAGRSIPPAAARPVGAFAMERATWDLIGPFDPALWSVGLLDDLAARAESRAPVVTGPPVSGSRAAWPLVPAAVRLLEWRNRLLTAFATRDAEALGVELARVAVEALTASTRASGLHGEQFRFGGGWGSAEGALARVLRPGANGAAHVRDHVGTLIPLLALDSALDELPRIVERRTAMSARQPSPPSSDPIATPATATPPSSSGTAPGPHPRVSVIVVNWNGRSHLEDCFGSILASDYPADRLEVICVDNGSTDGSRELVRERFPSVRLIELARNEGFTGGNAAGVAASTGDVLVFFNNDMRVERDAITHLVRAVYADGQAGCAAARVLSWDGRHVDFIRGTINFEARGFQDFYGEPASSERSRSAETFFPNGGAFALTREAYERAGGFDNGFFAYYDDVDLGWRLRLTGVPIRVEDAAVVYHRHGATSKAQPAGQKKFLMERNALWTVMKNYGEPALRRTLGAVLALAARRLVDEIRIDGKPAVLQPLVPFSRKVEGTIDVRAIYETDGTPRHDAAGTAVLTGFPAESLAAIGAALEALPAVSDLRRKVQQTRVVADPAVLVHFGRTFERLSTFSSYRPVQDALVRALDLPALFGTRTRLLIISHEAIAPNMSGPAVRFLEIGRALSDVARVTIAMPGTPALRDSRCTIAGFDPASPAGLRRLAEDADVLFVQGFTLTQYPFLKKLMLPIVVDLYCPFTIEHLEQLRSRGQSDDSSGASAAAGVLAVQNAQLDTGDFFVCASETQRDFWIGNLHARGRVNPQTYADDPTLRRLIDVVPFGLPDADFEATARALPPVLKGVRPGIGPDDEVLLWGGSLLDWQDPVTLIDAVARLVPHRPALRLFFMGTRHPNPLVGPMAAVRASRDRAEALGLLDTHVFFNDWVPYAERARYLFEADLGVSTHRDHLETHFSFRTRMLDYVWARLPIVCTQGDVFASLVERRGLGVAVPPGDSAALADAIAALLDDRTRYAAARAALDDLAGELRWSRVVDPLIRFCRNPHHAADRAQTVERIRAGLSDEYRVTKWLKRTALRAGVSELRIEQMKRLAPVQALMRARNLLALARARRNAERAARSTE
ncbi:MAG TPA: glycosyltransferase [Vicinamibacterales bacterium]